LSRSPAEIARLLESIRARGTLITAYLDEIRFQSLLRLVDPTGQRVILERSPLEAANTALLGRGRICLHADIPGWHVEFVGASPRTVEHEGQRAIELRFPEILVVHQPREYARGAVEPHVPLHCEADAGGIMPFDARMIDISRGGVGFLVYSSDISLEPGTVLRGCRIEVPGGGSLVTDLEVRYSQRVTLSDGTRALRSGCRFIDPPPQIAELVKRYVRDE
jgi:c-di-GMP-binding flagellar brake protein YcgR